MTIRHLVGENVTIRRRSRSSSFSIQNSTTHQHNGMRQCALVRRCRDCPRSRSNSAPPSNLDEQEEREPIPPIIANIGDVVTIDFELRGENDFIPEPLFDSNGIISFVLGWGGYLPGLHDLILGMAEGETAKGVSLDAGWGEHNPKLVAIVPRSSFGDQAEKITLGSELHLKSGVQCRVTDVTADNVKVDCNPPLAGASYLCNLKILRVEPGPRDDGSSAISNHIRNSPYELATFALGCFWGGELAFMRERGVVGTKVGYSQGHTKKPTYEQVCMDTTGHAESIRVVYNPEIVSFSRLVQIAIERLGDSAYLINQVGNDVGSQYRSGVYYHSEQQMRTARTMLRKRYGNDCEVELEPASDEFWPAEEYHQQYLLKGGQSARKGATETIRCYG